MTLVLRDYQQWALADLRAAWIDLRRAGVKAPRLLLVSRTGCHARGQGILMFDGTIRRVEDVSVGDRLMGPDSQPRHVLGLSRGRGNMVRVVPVKGRPFVVNEDHILTLVRTFDGWTAGGGLVDVTVRDWLGWSRKQKHIHKLIRAGVDFPETPADGRPIDPYFLGVLLGDGSFVRSVSVCKPDEEIRQVVREQAAMHGLDVRIGGTGTSASLFLTAGRHSGAYARNPITEKLRSLGLHGRDGGAKFVPQPYLTASRQDRLALLAGLMDTDGHLDSNGYDFISKSAVLSDGVAFLARSLGLAAYVTPCEKRAQTGNGGAYYRVFISGDTNLIPCRIPRKQAGPRTQKKDPLRTGFSVEPVGEDDFFGFTLDGDGRFLLDDFTITHNTGKTVLAGEFLTDVAGKGRRALFVVRDRVLIEQTSRHLDRIGLDEHGVIAAGHPRQRPDALIQVCSAQTLTARGQRPEADVLVIDEAHGVECSTSREIVDAYPDATILGLTATPVRGDGKPLGAPYGVFQKLVQVQVTFAELVAQGALVDCIVIAPKYRTTKDLAEKPVEVLTQYGRGRRVVIFGRDRKHAAELAAQASAAGFRAASVHGESDDRDELLERIGLPSEDPNALDVLTNCDLLKQGWDSPRADMLILARGCSSFSQYMQICGRVLRPVPPAERGLWTKPTALIFDLRGSVNKHGHPADDVEFSLEGKPVRRKDEEKLRQCPSCGATFRAKPACPLCGFVLASLAPRKPVRVVRVPLEVAKRRADMTPEEAQALELAQSRDYFEHLCKMACAKRWKPAAVGMRWKARYGKWPPWPLPQTGWAAEAD